MEISGQVPWIAIDAVDVEACLENLAHCADCTGAFNGVKETPHALKMQKLKNTFSDLGRLRASHKHIQEQMQKSERFAKECAMWHEEDTCHEGTRGYPWGCHKGYQRGYDKRGWQPRGFQGCRLRKESRNRNCRHYESGSSADEQRHCLSPSCARQMMVSLLSCPHAVCPPARTRHSPRWFLGMSLPATASTPLNSKTAHHIS